MTPESDRTTLPVPVPCAAASLLFLRPTAREYA